MRLPYRPLGTILRPRHCCRPLDLNSCSIYQPFSHLVKLSEKASLSTSGNFVRRHSTQGEDRTMSLGPFEEISSLHNAGPSAETNETRGNCCGDPADCEEPSCGSANHR